MKNKETYSNEEAIYIAMIGFLAGVVIAFVTMVAVML